MKNEKRKKICPSMRPCNIVIMVVAGTVIATIARGGTSTLVLEREIKKCMQSDG